LGETSSHFVASVEATLGTRLIPSEKIRQCRKPYQRNRHVAFLLVCMSTSGRIPGEFLRPLFFIDNKQADDCLHVAGRQVASRLCLWQSYTYLFLSVSPSVCLSVGISVGTLTLSVSVDVLVHVSICFGLWYVSNYISRA
jgi:hypothetical protein